MINCYKCKSKLELEKNQAITRNEECPRCFSDLRCCKMCQHYDTNSYNECRESMADRIIEKDKKNFCDYFSIDNPDTYDNSKNDLLNKANSLFK